MDKDNKDGDVEKSDNSSSVVVPKKILIDVTFLFDQYQSRGIGVYGKQLLKRLIPIITASKDWDLRLVGFNELENNLMQIGISPFVMDEIKEKIKFYSFGAPVVSDSKNIMRFRKLYLPLLEKIKPDIYFAVHFERGLPSNKLISRGLSFQPKTIVVAHDAIPLVLNKFSSKSKVHNFLKKRLYKLLWKGIQNADLVLSASNFSKKDLVKYGNVDDEKIEVVYLGVDSGFFKENNSFKDYDIEEVLNRFKLNEKRYFFYDAGLEENKGIPQLLEILKNIVNAGSDKLPETLVVVGNDFKKGEGKGIEPRNILAKKFLKLAKSAGVLENIVTTGRVTDEELKILLSKAQAYVNMSQYEGFSFGPVQAMASHVPAIASNTSCTPEITDGGALLVDVSNIELASKKIKNHLLHKSELQRFVEAGKEVVKKYDWDQTVEKTWELIQRVGVRN
jgi:glycosyltransferase involved in cell wall biosynthesis